MTKNGFSQPLDPYQVASWIIVLVNISLQVSLKLLVSFTLIEEVFFWSSEFSNLLLILLAFKVTKSSPTVSPYAEKSSPEKVQYFCIACNSYVFQNVKHCGKCDRCVSDFDHHCRWLNNCICKQNYRSFILLVCSLELNSLLVLCLYFSLVNTEEMFPFILIGILVYFFVLLSSTWLLVIHIYFCALGITTYQFLTKNRAKVENELKESSSDETGMRNKNDKIEIKSQEILATEEGIEDNRLIKTAEDIMV